MENDDEIMTAAEFFGETENGMCAGGSSGARSRRKRNAKNGFADIKAHMVMRIYGVTRAKAEKIIAERDAKVAKGESSDNSAGTMKDRPSDDVEMMSAEEFFGEV